MRSVYVVDDEPELRAIMTEALEAEGYEVSSFPDAGSLMDALGEGRPDAILLDINLPDRSGWSIKRSLNEDPGTRGIPAIAVTARGGESVERSARDGLGFADFVQKPFRLTELIDAIETAMEADR